jgi:hypothetical protein
MTTRFRHASSTIAWCSVSMTWCGRSFRRRRGRAAEGARRSCGISRSGGNRATLRARAGRGRLRVRVPDSNATPEGMSPCGVRTRVSIFAASALSASNSTAAPRGTRRRSRRVGRRTRARCSSREDVVEAVEQQRIPAVNVAWLPAHVLRTGRTAVHGDDRALARWRRFSVRRYANLNLATTNSTRAGRNSARRGDREERRGLLAISRAARRRICAGRRRHFTSRMRARQARISSRCRRVGPPPWLPRPKKTPALARSPFAAARGSRRALGHLLALAAVPADGGRYARIAP